MTTINLRDGLEALYYFREQDFDPQRNLLKDHSGYARHATANGGPTVGVNGPNDFEATSFDGSDDFFNVNSPLGVSGSQTVMSIAKIEDGNTESRIASNDGNGGEGFRIRNNSRGSMQVELADGNGNRVKSSLTKKKSEWALYGFVYDGSSIRAFTNNTLTSKQSVSTHTVSGSNLIIGNTPNLNAPLSGETALFARWSRALSDAGIAQLNRLTAPMEAKL